MSNPIRLAGVIRESIVDGPGIRFVVFVQGCPHHCEGCHNPESHDFSGGYDCDPEKILAEIKKNPLLDGVTFSGGEPLCQAAALLPLAKEIKKLGLNLFIYTGSIFEDLLKEQNPDIMALLQQGDFLVDGPFVLAQRLDAAVSRQPKSAYPGSAPVFSAGKSGFGVHRAISVFVGRKQRPCSACSCTQGSSVFSPRTKIAANAGTCGKNLFFRYAIRIYKTKKMIEEELLSQKIH